MTREQFRRLRSLGFPHSHDGEVVRGSRIRVEQMFVYDDFNGTTRHGKLLISTPTGASFVAYCDWVYIKPELRALD